MNAFSAFESLHVDDLINEVGSSSSSTTSEAHRNPSSSLHNLPAWSTSEEGETWHKTSPAFSDELDEDKTISDVWFASSTTLSRKKRTTFSKGDGMQEREDSPGAAANLKSHKSAPQLVPRTPSADHKAKLEDLLVEMGWPRESASTAEGSQSQGGMSTQSGSGSSEAPRSSTGAGSLASGMPATGALFKRRAHLREGNLPLPSPVVVPGTDRFEDQVPATSMPAVPNHYLDGQQHSRSATFPLSHGNPIPDTTFPRQGPSTAGSDFASFQRMSSLHRGSNHVLNASQPLFAQENSDRATKAVEAALLYGMGPRRASFSQHFSNSPGALRRPDTASSGGTATELQTPITPFQSLSASEAGVPFAYQVSPAVGSTNHLLPGYGGGYTSGVKMPHDECGNSLGLQHMKTMTQSHTPVNIDSSAYSQIFAGMPQAAMVPASPTKRQKVKQMRSSPNMRTSPTSDTSSQTTTPLRKIASNRRLASTARSESSNSSQTLHKIVLQSPSKSPSKKGRSPRLETLPPLPTMAPLQPSATSGSFEFVNYGMDDADELCAAVAPSGSYKIPLKGFGSGDGDEEGSDGCGTGAGQDEQARLRRSRSKSNSRLGPRWQGPNGLGEEVPEGGVQWEGEQQDKTASRQIKRRKSEASMTTLPGKRKTASSGNLRRKD